MNNQFSSFDIPLQENSILNTSGVKSPSLTAAYSHIYNIVPNTDNAVLHWVIYIYMFCEIPNVKEVRYGLVWVGTHHMLSLGDKEEGSYLDANLTTEGVSIAYLVMI